ncbi:peptidylprolyl isomerase [Pseudanabaena sp. PCC 6802]|uniref:peptidylprolyl isomerase n=1 Tax=Pseudanabaena sp. PCC 6802 TaxID=118173 RepID=UPI000348C0FC|nr:peptidylprolyl isomerase [Pseudanabaena sp. PCC 6802]
MAEIFQIGNKKIEAEALIGLLRRYQLLPQLIRGIIIDEAIASYECTETERKDLLEKFFTQNKLETPEARSSWQQVQGLTDSQLEDVVMRPTRLSRFKQEKFGHKVESYFMTRKPALDRVLYSLIRTKDLGTAQELYFRIQEEEQSFADLAKQYSQGGEAATGGLVGPTPLVTPHPAIARTLAISQPGQLWPPTRLEEWFVLIRLEKFYPAQLDENTRQQLIDELYESWMKEQIQQIGAVKPA